jgi:hypothetical protein
MFQRKVSMTGQVILLLDFEGLLFKKNVIYGKSSCSFFVCLSGFVLRRNILRVCLRYFLCLQGNQYYRKSILLGLRAECLLIVARNRGTSFKAPFPIVFKLVLLDVGYKLTPAQYEIDKEQPRTNTF